MTSDIFSTSDDVFDHDNQIKNGQKCFGRHFCCQERIAEATGLCRRNDKFVPGNNGHNQSISPPSILRQHGNATLIVVVIQFPSLKANLSLFSSIGIG